MSLDDKISRRKFLKDSAIVIAGIAGLDVLLRNGVLAGEELEEVFADNHAEKVYQNPNPVIVVHTGPGRYNNLKEPCDRMRKVILSVKEKYQSLIDFYEFDYEKFFPELSNNERVEKYARMFYDPRFHKRLDSLLDMQQVTHCPSTFMYHREDILTGKKHDTEQPNFLIDILKGGPTDDKYIKAWINNVSIWIEQNLLGKYADEPKVLRYRNTGDEHLIPK